MNDPSIKLLKKQRARGLTGFTIPFLIGASRKPVGNKLYDEHQCYGEFVDLLNLFHRASGFHIGISECVTIKQPVVALYASQKLAEDYGLQVIQSSSLFASSKYQKKQKLDSLMEQLWRLSETPILQGKFSFEKGEYIEFTTEDIRFIEGVVSSA
jgi:hypothetical protein